MARHLGHVLEHPCAECGGEMILRDSEHGLFYGCTNFPRCDGTHTAHKQTGKPMGIPADKSTKRWRMAAHGVFDVLWKGKVMTRHQAYAWLAETMEMSHEEGHISRLDKYQCKVVIREACLRLEDADVLDYVPAPKRDFNV